MLSPPHSYFLSVLNFKVEIKTDAIFWTTNLPECTITKTFEFELTVSLSSKNKLFHRISHLLFTFQRQLCKGLFVELCSIFLIFKVNTGVFSDNTFRTF